MMQFLRLLFAPCSEISRHASLSLDTELPRSHRFAIRFHTLYCKACRRYRQHIQFIRQALRRITTGESPADVASSATLSPAARQRILHHLHEH